MFISVISKYVIYICIYISNFTSSWDFVILVIIGYHGQAAIFGVVYAHKGRTKKNQRHGLHGFVCTGSAFHTWNWSN